MKIVLLGAPGSGKGTLSEFLKKHYNIPHISTGDIFRDAMAKQSELGLLAKSFIDRGQLVSDQVTVDLVKDRISQKDCKNGFILDGFPRTVVQAKMLTSIVEIDMAIYFDVDFDIALKRMLSRRVCSVCKSIFNTNTYSDTTCNKCGGVLIHREDDNEQIIRQRFEVYNQVTYPVVDYYKSLGLLRNFDANHSAQDSYKMILKVVGE